MQYVVYGAGAVGGVVGGTLARAGHPVTLVARGAHLAAIRDRGLVLDAGDGRNTVEAAATDTAAEVDWTGDIVVVLAVKSHQAAVALDDLRRHAPAETPVVCATNGIATEVAALRLFARTYAVCVMLPASHLEPGVVVAACHPTPAILDIGRIPGGTDATTAAVRADLLAAGIACEERDDILAWKRRKLLTNLGNGVDASFAQGAAADELAERALAEGEAVLAAAGLAVVSAEDDTARRGSILQRRPDLERGGGSTWQSLARGTGDSEIDYLSGEVVLQGRLAGVRTPVNDAVVAATRRLAAAGGAPRSLDAAEVLAIL
ncbi:2-dehydropantoate 2-reductase [Nocardioides sp. Root122]|uniref:ketopantoate reductase family protein n=1 Tax=Nocardioides TaxID=1839 RepID=UPI000702E3FB|nr:MULTISPECIES: 2-dehydropantoate 2-reductase N-terminal domain-containing protein [Nocardioides]KQV72652.1 2-dehydropantoate 2-reductase [Nocardioides sp. Root122]MCK9825390.1 ketopantoate reductase family protein [Nocardioides cavernae]